jgi:hypothetical protein
MFGIFRCSAAVFPLLSAAVLRGKMKQIQNLAGNGREISEQHERAWPG